MPSTKKKKKGKKTKSKSAAAKRVKKSSRAKRASTSARSKKTPKKSRPKKKASKSKLAGERAPRGRARNIELRSARKGAVGAARSADFRGLSRAEQADSESVDELVEEGNIFEAGAVSGVQEADESDEKEVQTHELPEDDVPEEYLDEE